jgi:hypothetical protein
MRVGGRGTEQMGEDDLFIVMEMCMKDIGLTIKLKGMASINTSMVMSMKGFGRMMKRKVLAMRNYLMVKSTLATIQKDQRMVWVNLNLRIKGFIVDILLWASFKDLALILGEMVSATEVIGSRIK